MANEPLSVRYRPKKFSDVVGQEVAVKTITNAFKDKNLHHAYIFEGQYGCGKTTSARILAAMENCKEGPTLEPCGKCTNCIEIFSGKSLDIKEIDAASNRGVDDIRQIKDDIRYSPMQCRTKYVILDEAHSLTAVAAEALLKSIEEPPPHVRFILCTTEAFALKPTIHSRCQTLQFTKVSWHQIYGHLVNVARQENMSFEEEALKLAAKRSKGSVRDSLQNLQALKDFSGADKITLDAAQKALGSISESVYFDLVSHIMTPDVPKAMLKINDLVVTARNSEQIIKGLEEHLSNLLVIAACKENVAGLGFTEDEVKRYANQAQTARPIIVSKMLSMLIDVQRAVSLNLDIQNYLEKFVVDSIIEKAKLTKDSKKA